MTNMTILANAKIILPDAMIHGALTLQDGKITSIDEGPHLPAGAVDCEGDMIAPGLIELHTDNIERHIQPRPSVDWPHANAIIAHDAELAGCGITTVFDAMRVGSVPSGRGGYSAYARGLASELLALRASEALKISHFLHLRAEVCSATLEQEIGEFGAEDRVGLVSIMDHTPGQRQFRDVGKLKQYVQGKQGLTDAEFDAHVSELTALRDANGARHERVAVAAAKSFGAVLASHDDTLRGHVETSAAHGIRLAEFPTTLEAAQACRDHGIAVMMGAPNLIRGGSHSGNVAAAELADAGLLDILSSDYVPAALLLGAVQLGARWGDMARGLATVTAAPAAAAGLTDRGRIAQGLRADLIRLRLVNDAPVLRGVYVRGARVS